MAGDIQCETEVFPVIENDRTDRRRAYLEVLGFVPTRICDTILKVFVDSCGNLVQADDDVGIRGNVCGIIPELAAS